MFREEGAGIRVDVLLVGVARLTTGGPTAIDSSASLISVSIVSSQTPVVTGYVEALAILPHLSRGGIVISGVSL